ncbi:hypothetical protein G7Y89_g4221 [Cudoniella acicularis]|uniref:F-box domain-containing protein n=1 Tax=Cudoniella acicularis TaxID=354080 RepID=A0A8H4RS11_9HELO|nr:hypothetical protein G7Y89_g4221 [Cudoniella acicularis]
MSANFLSLPSELRNNIYEQLLVLQEPVACPTHPWFGQSQLRALTPGLLRANKTVHLEASSILYAQNRFDFTMCTSEDVTSFLDQIGRNNASYILYTCVDFPKFHYLDLHDVTLEDDSVRILAKIQSDCTRLGTLTTSLHSTNAMEVKLDALDYPKVVGEALALVDARFRAISSLQEIIVEVYEDGPSDHIRREMKNRGWTISTTEYVEESDFDRSFSDIQDDYYRYDDDSGGGGDDYDIDDDSDFWRRAGD